MTPEIHITPQELKDNYEYKVSARILKQQFPWITSVSFNEDDVNKYGLIFLDLGINPNILSEETGWQLASYAQYDYENRGMYNSPYLSTLMDITYEQGKELSAQLEKALLSVHNSPAIPSDLKLPRGRKLAVGNYHLINPDFNG